jgi:hypothetical protein
MTLSIKLSTLETELIELHEQETEMIIGGVSQRSTRDSLRQRELDLMAQVESDLMAQVKSDRAQRSLDLSNEHFQLAVAKVTKEIGRAIQ